MHVILLGFFLFLFPATGAAKAPLTVKKGMVAADSATASRIGAEILARGGDAVDAAIATTLVLGVIQPFASGLGGGGFAVVHRSSGRSYALDFREVAPRRATRNMYLNTQGEVIPGASTRGPRAAGVPGEVAGLAELHTLHGRLPWRELVRPALELARDGFPCNPLLHEQIMGHHDLIAARPRLAKQFLTPSGKAVTAGSIIRRPRLAKTLASIATHGAMSFYKGDVAGEIGRAMKADGGLIDAQDLLEYRVRTRKPVDQRVLGLRFLSMPPPSSGGAVLVQILRVLEGLPLGKLGWNSAAYIHRVTEAMKHAFADRANIMGDPAFTPVPMKRLLGDVTRDRVRSSFDPKKTLPNATYGGKYASPSDGGTSHLSVVDAAGNAIALTTTINTGFGSLYVAGETGVIMNNEMDDFVARPGVPNAFGLVGREANAIAPGKIPLSSMSPTIVLKDGHVYLVAGASGGPTIITGTLQVILNVIVFGFDARKAVESARFHHQWQPDHLFLEPAISKENALGLTRLGHVVRRRERTNSVQLIQVGGGKLSGASDPSKYGRPAGVDGARGVVVDSP